MPEYSLGAIPSVRDSRDYQYAKLRSMVGTFPSKGPPVLPIPIRDQGQIPACVGFGCQRMKDEQEYKNYSSIISTSPAYIYTYCKQLDGNPYAPGTYPRVAMQVLQSLGVCRESTFPYSMMPEFGLPAIPPRANEEAPQFKIKAYSRVNNLAEIKQAILTDGPVVLSVMVCDNFMNADGGRIPIPEGMLMGHHLIAAVTWDDEMAWGPYRGVLKFANSWSEEWGDEGYGYLPYAFLDYHTDLQPACTEAWSSVDVIIPPPQASKVEMWVGKKIARVDGQEYELEQAPFIFPGVGRTLVPIRFVSENMGYIVDWDSVARKITLTKR